MTKEESQRLRVEITRIANRANVPALRAISMVREMIADWGDAGPRAFVVVYLDRLRLDIIELGENREWGGDNGTIV
jgi:hypothetical protein